MLALISCSPSSFCVLRSGFSSAGLTLTVPSLAEQLLPRRALPALLALVPMACWFRALVAFMLQALDLREKPAVSHCGLT